MVEVSDLLLEDEITSIPIHYRMNLLILAKKMTMIEQASGIPLKVTSGFRTMKNHMRVYLKKGITDITKIPVRSKHLTGEACDIEDKGKELQEWCLANESLLIKLELWIENFTLTPNWVHFQSSPPKSGKRFFIP